MTPDQDTTVLAISDVHGYFDEAYGTLEAVSDYLQEEEGRELLDYDDDDGWQWEGGEAYTLVFNGDMINRGDENEAVLDMVFGLQDDAPDGRVRYNVGNHEVFALFPDVFKDLYLEHVFDDVDELTEAFDWYDMDEDYREELIERAASGDITVGYEGHDHDYIHAGDNEEHDLEELNERLEEVGERLQDGYQEWQDTGDRDAFIEAQEAFIRMEDGEKQVEDAYDEIFRSGSERVRDEDAGVTLMDFRHMEDDAPAQVVGHTTATGMPDDHPDANPQRVGGAVNINTIRDSVNADDGEDVPVAVSVEDTRGIAVLLYDGEDVDRREI